MVKKEVAMKRCDLVKGMNVVTLFKGFSYLEEDILNNIKHFYLLFNGGEISIK